MKVKTAAASSSLSFDANDAEKAKAVLAGAQSLEYDVRTHRLVLVPAALSSPPTAAGRVRVAEVNASRGRGAFRSRGGGVENYRSECGAACSQGI
jgi:hypothetical protein